MEQQRREHTVRVAEPHDAAAIAEVHVRSWRSAYAGLVPTEHLSALDVAARTATWREHLGLSDRRAGTWVAEVDGEITGFVATGPSRDEDAERGTSEVYAIYLDPGTWGTGVARDLLRTALGAMPPGTPVTLWTLADNERSRHFYRRHGFSPDGTERFEDVGGVDLLQVRYRRS